MLITSFGGMEVATNFWARTTSHKESSKYVPGFICTGTKDHYHLTKLKQKGFTPSWALVFSLHLGTWITKLPRLWQAGPGQNPCSLAPPWRSQLIFLPSIAHGVSQPLQRHRGTICSPMEVPPVHPVLTRNNRKSPTTLRKAQHKLLMPCTDGDCAQHHACRRICFRVSRR